MNFLLRNTSYLNSGTYQLYIYLVKSIIIFHPRFGNVNFPGGLYIYSGSAKRNLLQRINRHLKKRGKKQHWHIDFILTNKNAKIIMIKIFRDKNKTECQLNFQTKQKTNSKILLKDFGSTDCRNCQSHLLYISPINES